MSLKAYNWAMKQKLDPCEKVLLLKLADHANDDGVAWQKLRTLMDVSNRSRSTVQRSLKKLEARQLLIRKQQWRPDGGRNVDEFCLCIDDTSISGNVCDRSPSTGSEHKPTTHVASTKRTPVSQANAGTYHSRDHNKPSYKPNSPPDPPHAMCRQKLLVGNGRRGASLANVEPHQKMFKVEEGSEVFKAWQVAFMLQGVREIPSFLFTQMPGTSRRMLSVRTEHPPIGSGMPAFNKQDWAFIPKLDPRWTDWDSVVFKCFARHIKLDRKWNEHQRVFVPGNWFPTLEPPIA